MFCAWAAVVLAAGIVHDRTGARIPVCMFKRLTGYTCATCGGTRCAIALAKGNVAGAFRLNPLVALFLVTTPIWAGVWAYRRRRHSPPLGPGLSRVLLAAFLAALALNWWYVIAQGR